MMGLISDLKKRNNLFNMYSTNLIKEYGPCMRSAAEKLTESKLDIKWSMLDFHPHNTMLMIAVGVGTHKVGQIIKNDAEEVIYVDESNVKNYVVPLKFIFPLHSVNEKDADTLTIFLMEYGNLLDEFGHDELEVLITNPAFLKEKFTAFGEKFSDVKITGSMKNEYEGFNLDELELDDVQLQYLRNNKPEGQS